MLKPLIKLLYCSWLIALWAIGPIQFLYAKDLNLYPARITKQITPIRYPSKIVFDSFGRAWFAGYDGLHLKVGSEIKPFKTVLGGLESRYTDIYYDRSLKKLFAVSTYGVVSIDEETLKSELIPYDGEVPTEDRLAKRVLSNGGSELWIAVDGKFYEYSFINQEKKEVDIFSKITKSRNWNDYEIYGLEGSDNGGIYLQTKQGITVYNRRIDETELLYKSPKSSFSWELEKLGEKLYFVEKSKAEGFQIKAIDTIDNTVHSVSKLNEKLKEEHLNVTSIVADSKIRALWLSLEKEGEHFIYLYRVDEKSFEFIYNASSVRVNQLAASNGSLYLIDDNYYLTSIESYNHLKILDENNTKVSRFTSAIGIEGEFYLGSDHGLIKIDSNKPKIISGTEKFKINSVTTNNQKDRVIFSSGNRIFNYDLVSEKVSLLTLNESIGGDASDTSWYEAVNSNPISNVTIADKENIYYETYNEGLWVFNGEGHKLHESNRYLNHVRYNLNLEYVYDRLYVFRQGNSVVELFDKEHKQWQIRGLAIQERRYQEALNKPVTKNDVGILNERFHRNVYLTDGELWMSYGNGDFTRFDKNYELSKLFKSPVENAQCLQKAGEGLYYLVAGLKIYSWNIALNRLDVIKDFTGLIDSNTNLSGTICNYSEGRFLLGNTRSIVWFNLKDDDNLESKSFAFSSTKIELLNRRMELIEDVPYIFSKEMDIKVDHPEARFVKISYEQNNNFSQPTMIVKSGAYGYEGKDAIIPIEIGRKTYQVSAKFGSNEVEIGAINIDSEYTFKGYISLYWLHISVLIVVSILIFAFWKYFMRKQLLLKSRVRHNYTISSINISRIDNHIMSLLPVIEKMKSTYPMLKTNVDTIMQTVKAIGDEVVTMKPILLGESEEDIGEGYQFSIGELVQRICELDDGLCSSQVEEFKNKTANIKGSKSPLIYFLSECLQQDSSFSLEIKEHSSSFTIEIKFEAETSALLELYQAVLKPHYNISKLNGKLNIVLEKTKSFKEFSAESLNNLSDLHDYITKKKSNILVIGSIEEFDTAAKRYWIEQLLKSSYNGAKLAFITNSKSNIDAGTQYPITHRLYLSLYSRDFSLVAAAASFDKNPKLVLTNEEWFNEAIRHGADRTISRNVSPSNLRKLYGNLEEELKKLDQGDFEIIERLNKQIDKFIDNQMKGEPQNSKVFPQWFKLFCELQGFKFTKSEVKEVEEKAGEDIMTYCKRYRARKFAEHISQNPDIMVTEHMLYFGFGAKSRTINIFKEEFGVTPDRYRQMLKNQTTN